jgi:3-phenylpropionate/cinnamic acid dioxygenase small subunit
MTESKVEKSDIGIERRLAALLLKDDVTEFLHHEADLLDERLFDDWLALLDDEIEYTMPLRLNVKQDEMDRSVTRPGDEVCWFDEGKSTLIKRVEQIQTGEHWAEEPFSRVSHLITNVRILSVEPDPFDPIEVEVGCRFLVYRNRVAAETDFWVGRRTDTLRATSDGWRLRRRYLLLDQSVLLAKNLTVLF